jgi:hypothetical protein
VRALTAARALLGFPVVARTQAEAAAMTRSTVRYVVAAAIVLQAEDPALLADVTAGRISLLAAARIARGRAELISAYRRATAADRSALARAVGPASVWDDVLAPAL